MEILAVYVILETYIQGFFQPITFWGFTCTLLGTLRPRLLIAGYGVALSETTEVALRGGILVGNGLCVMRQSFPHSWESSLR